MVSTVTIGRVTIGVVEGVERYELGQVQFGIPCVVGGALSTAAVKYLGPDGGSAGQ